MERQVAVGFEPFFAPDGEVLILGSFPSVKSRQTSFYYGNPRNAFWKILSGFFGEREPIELEEKKDFLIRRKIALWDIVTECEIAGSSDQSIKNYKVADLNRVFTNCKINAIILNGGTALRIFARHYGDISTPVFAAPSTSPANTKPKTEEWYDLLRRAFSRA